jgi:hypothetical protein
MRIFPLLLMFLTTCSSATSPPTSNLAGRYTLSTVNGSSLPAQYTVPLLGSVVASSGSATIGADFSFSITVNTDAGAGTPSTTWSVTGNMTQESTYYHFTFNDGRNGNGSYSGGAFTILYPPNTLVFTKN